MEKNIVIRCFRGDTSKFIDGRANEFLRSGNTSASPLEKKSIKTTIQKYYINGIIVKLGSTFKHSLILCCRLFIYANQAIHCGTIFSYLTTLEFICMYR